ncbi:MAG TPA: Fur family transcriptional regulator [Nitriliruptorales bacterium]|nr:Fur family transcriptional regulator [Nitriliruptorales bacterium]
MDQHQIGELLRARGHRVTAPRRAVWTALRESPDHRTVEELTAAARRHEPGVNLASVYRTLALFQELGIAREARLADEDAGRWEVAHPDDHFHVVCEHCGAVDHHAGELVERVRTHLGGEHGFDARTIELTVTGRCADCSDSMTDSMTDSIANGSHDH